MFVSDCCTAPVVLGDICQKCGEHCGVIDDETGEYANEADYIPGYDDGEACSS